MRPVIHISKYSMQYTEFRELKDGTKFVMEEALCGQQYWAIKVGMSVRPTDGKPGILKEELREHQYWSPAEFFHKEYHYTTFSTDEPEKCIACGTHPDLPLIMLGALPG